MAARKDETSTKANQKPCVNGMTTATTIHMNGNVAIPSQYNVALEKLSASLITQIVAMMQNTR